jgi:hypothetical protein
MSQQLEHRQPLVGLVEMGEPLPLNLLSLARRLNRLQSACRFHVVGSITAEALGDPDVRDHSYDAQNLQERLSQFSSVDSPGFLVGVTNVRLAAKPAASRRFETDYFSLSDFSKVAVISTHHSIAQFRGPTVTMDQYVGHLLMCELLMLIAKKNLSHTSNRLCLFDECEDRSALKMCIDNASICPTCVAALKQNNVSTDTIQSALRVLRWCRRNQWSFVIRFTLSHPVTALSVGTALGWYSSAFVSARHATEFATLTLVPVLLVAAYARFVMK